ncbi:MAG: hypothetical protein AB1757_07845 [Acidobacteriota bacterium]
MKVTSQRIERMGADFSRPPILQFVTAYTQPATPFKYPHNPPHPLGMSIDIERHHLS